MWTYVRADNAFTLDLSDDIVRGNSFYGASDALCGSEDFLQKTKKNEAFSFVKKAKKIKKATKNNLF